MTEGQIQGGAEPLGLVLGILCVFFMAGTLGYFAMNLRPLIVALRRGATVESPLVPGLAIAGVGVALYLGYVRLAGTVPVCGPLIDCGLVQTSTYADFLGVPVALLGVGANVGLFLLWWQQRYGRGPATASLLLLAALATAFSLYLTIVELFVLHAICPWCLLAAMLFTAILATVGLLVLDQAPRPSYLGN